MLRCELLYYTLGYVSCILSRIYVQMHILQRCYSSQRLSARNISHILQSYGYFTKLRSRIVILQFYSKTVSIVWSWSLFKQIDHFNISEIQLNMPWLFLILHTIRIQKFIFRTKIKLIHYRFPNARTNTNSTYLEIPNTIFAMSSSILRTLYTTYASMYISYTTHAPSKDLFSIPNPRRRGAKESRLRGIVS